MTSIYEVAVKAGVSITTVSHVFSGNRRVSEKTASRVFAAAKKLNYLPSSTAKGLATGRSMIVGIAIPFSDAGETMRQNPYYSELLAHVSDVYKRQP